MGRKSPTPEMWNVLVTQKGEHFYAFLYTDSGGQKYLLRSLTQFANNRKLNFTHTDAKKLYKEARLIPQQGGM